MSKSCVTYLIQQGTCNESIERGARLVLHSECCAEKAVNECDGASLASEAALVPGFQHCLRLAQRYLVDITR